MKVAIYFRVANKDQAALPLQESGMKPWSARQEHEIVDVFRSMMPESSLGRAGLQSLIRNLDRLARGAELAHALAELPRESGVRIASPRETGVVFTGRRVVRQSKVPRN